RHGSETVIGNTETTIEHAIDAGAGPGAAVAGLDDRAGGTRAADSQVAGDVQVTRGVEVLAVPGDGERIYARRDVDGIGATAGRAVIHRRIGVCRLDRLSQRAVAVGVELVRVGVHADRGCTEWLRWQRQ